VINVLDPEVVVLGGGMSNSERLYERIPRLRGDYVFAAAGTSVNSERAASNAQRPIRDFMGPEADVHASNDERLRAGKSGVRSPDIRTRLVRAKQGDASGVRGAAWLWGDDR
jgi:fructokinase